jgi:hypothetical protein
VGRKLLFKAAEDETSIQIEEVPDGPFGFHAQQAIEKLIKALLSQLSIPFDHTHNISKLAQQVDEAGEKLPAVSVALADLNKFAVIYRYDSIPSLEIPDRPAIIATVRLIREHVVARITLSPQPPRPLRYNRHKRLPRWGSESPARPAHQSIYASQKPAGSPYL